MQYMQNNLMSEMLMKLMHACLLMQNARSAHPLIEVFNKKNGKTNKSTS